MSIFFLKLKNIICSFQLFENGRIHNVVWALINVMKHDVENNSIVSTFSNVVNINVEIDNVDLTLFNVVNFNIDIHKAVLKLICHFPTLRCHITLATTLRLRWKVSWVLTNVAERLHSFLKLIKSIKHIYLAEYLLIGAFVNFRKGIDRPISVEKKMKIKRKKSRNRKKHCLNNGYVKEKWAKKTQYISSS